MATKHYNRSIHHRIMESRVFGGRTVDHGLHNNIEHESGHIPAQADLARGMSRAKTLISPANVLAS